MARENGTIRSCKVSENEFAYVWIFGAYVQGVRSPSFGKTCEELSDFFLEYTENHKTLGQNVQITLALKGCKLPINISSAKLIYQREGFSRDVSFKPYNILAGEIDIKSSMALYEYKIPQYLLLENGSFMFSIVVKLNKDYIASPTTSLLPRKKESSGETTSVLFNEESKNTPYADNPQELIQNLRALYTSGRMYDLEIHIGEDILKAHKLILCARSRVFMKMMEHDCLESSSNSIIINDCYTHVFKIFLKYLYTGEIENRKMETVMPLYSLSDKYDIPALRKASFEIIENTFLYENDDVVADIVSDILQLAECHSDMKLKELAVNFIVKHFPLVSNKHSWKDLMRSDFELTSEVLAHVVTACKKMKNQNS